MRPRASSAIRRTSKCGGNSAVIRYRDFRNFDPPRLLRLWLACELGPAAARPASTDVFELFVYSQQFFDPAGLILAFDGDRLVGFVHAGFGYQADGSGLDRRLGVICAIMVSPDVRRRGIGRELLRRAEEYLHAEGATEVRAGPAPLTDPYYFGIYGGSRPSGFHLSDPAAEPFFLAGGYEVWERHAVYQRNLTESRDPVNLRLMTVRRQTELTVGDAPPDPTWWWYTHFGRWDSLGIETLRFWLTLKDGGDLVAGVTVLGLDQYLSHWQTRAVGLVDLHVREDRRGEGFGQALLVEVAKRLRQEFVALAEIHAPESNAPALRAVESAGFERTDTGIVYRKAGEAR